MNAEMTSNILRHLEDRSISNEIKSAIFPILDEHKNRVQFVKNFIGLNDILYFEEDDMYFYEFPIFLSLDCKGENTIDWFADLYERAHVKINEIEDNLLSFFETTNRTLFVEVGFNDNILKNDDIWDVYREMEENRDKEPFELMISKYKYPEWYNVQDGQSICRIERSIDCFKELERTLASNRIIVLKAEIDELLFEENYSEIKNVSKKIESLQKLLN